MTSKIKQHSDICAELTALYERKNHDYGDSFARNYEKFGLVYPLIHMQEKLDRIEALRTNDAKVAGEGIADSLMDLANYAIMTLVECGGENANTETNRNDHGNCTNCRYIMVKNDEYPCNQCPRIGHGKNNGFSDKWEMWK